MEWAGHSSPRICTHLLVQPTPGASSVPYQGAGQPEEVAPSFLFLTSDDKAYMTGQVLHPNGGEIING